MDNYLNGNVLQWEASGTFSKIMALKLSYAPCTVQLPGPCAQIQEAGWTLEFAFLLTTGDSRTVLRSTEKCSAGCLREEQGEDFIPESCQVSPGAVAPSEP